METIRPNGRTFILPVSGVETALTIPAMLFTSLIVKVVTFTNCPELFILTKSPSTKLA